MNKAVVELFEEMKDFLSFGEEQKGQEGEGSAALQNANEAEVMLLDVELNVLKGPSRDDYSK